MSYQLHDIFVFKSDLWVIFANFLLKKWCTCQDPNIKESIGKNSQARWRNLKNECSANSVGLTQALSLAVSAFFEITTHNRFLPPYKLHKLCLFFCFLWNQKQISKTVNQWLKGLSSLISELGKVSCFGNKFDNDIMTMRKWNFQMKCSSLEITLLTGN